MAPPPRLSGVATCEPSSVASNEINALKLLSLKKFLKTRCTPSFRPSKLHNKKDAHIEMKESLHSEEGTKCSKLYPAYGARPQINASKLLSLQNCLGQGATVRQGPGQVPLLLTASSPLVLHSSGVPLPRPSLLLFSRPFSVHQSSPNLGKQAHASYHGKTCSSSNQASDPLCAADIDFLALFTHPFRNSLLGDTLDYIDTFLS